MVSATIIAYPILSEQLTASSRKRTVSVSESFSFQWIVSPVIITDGSEGHFRSPERVSSFKGISLSSLIELTLPALVGSSPVELLISVITDGSGVLHSNFFLCKKCFVFGENFVTPVFHSL